MSVYRYKFDIVEPDVPEISRLIRLAAEQTGVNIHEFAKMATISAAQIVLRETLAKLDSPEGEPNGEGET